MEPNKASNYLGAINTGVWSASYFTMEIDPRADDCINLPTDFADHLAAVSNLETPPETVTEYWSTFADQLVAGDQTIEPEDLYTENPTQHEVRVNGHIRYLPCVLDALGAAVMEVQTPVTVRSVDPVTRTPVTFTVKDETIDVAPEDALITFGIASTIPELESSDESIFSLIFQEDTPSVSEVLC